LYNTVKSAQQNNLPLSYAGANLFRLWGF